MRRERSSSADSPNSAADGLVYNSAAVVDGTGVLAVYRKTHLWDKEKLVFTPGAAAPPVVDTPVGRVGVLICFDLEFPEMPRTLALGGAELIVAPTNWPLETVPDGERVPEVTVAMAAAYSNHVAIAACDRVGIERGQDWNGASCIVDETRLGRRDTLMATVSSAADLDLSLSHDKTAQRTRRHVRRPADPSCTAPSPPRTPKPDLAPSTVPKEKHSECNQDQRESGGLEVRSIDYVPKSERHGRCGTSARCGS